MQRVVRSTLVGLLTLAGLAACNDSNTPITPTTGLVHSVTVNPTSLTLAVGGTATFTAFVDADANVSRTVTWSSSDATVASVDATAGTVKAIKAGTVTIIATSAADPTAKGAASLTVGAGNTAPVTVSISSINTTICGTSGCNSVPANLSNFGTASGGTGQLDVVLNVDAGGQILQSVTAVLKCGNDSLVQTQTISSSSIAAEAATAPVTVSFNTAQFNATTGVPALHNNAACTITASAKTSTGTQSASAGQTLTLNNTDFISTSITTAPITGQVASAAGVDGLVWRAGNVTVTALPVLFTAGRTIGSMSISLVNAGTNGASDFGPGGAGPIAAGATVATTATAISAAPFTFTFPDTATTNNTSVLGVSVDTLGVTVNTIDGSGATGPSVVVGSAKANAIRLDNLAPSVAGIAANFNTQNASNGFIGPNFAFTTAAGSITGMGTASTGAPVNCVNTDPLCDFRGVDKVTFTTQFSTAAAATTFTTFTSPSSIPETSTGTADNLRLRVCDALGNCANTAVLGQFGVDLTPPTITAATGPANQTIVGIGQTLSPTAFTISASDPQGAGGTTTGSGFSTTPVRVTETVLAPSGTSSQTSTCVAGFGTASAVSSAGNTTCTAPSAQGLSFTPQESGPGLYTVTYFVVDQAGNQSAPVTVQFYIDQAAPTVSGGVALPATVTTGTSFSTTAADNMDLASANGFLTYPVAIAAQTNPVTKLSTAGTLSATGTAFDNVLTRSATATFTPAQFYRSLSTISGGVIQAGPSKPTFAGVRAVDAANNLSTPDSASLPAANISGTPTQAFVVGTALSDFFIGADNTTLSNGSGSGFRATNLTATVIAPNATATTPFTQVCFYIITPSGTQGGQANTVTGTAAGELTLLGCQTGASTTVVGGNRAFQYTMSFDPAAGYGTSGNLQFVAIGSNANTDALATQAPATVTLAP
jgi:hypothetical protein